MAVELGILDVVEVVLDELCALGGLDIVGVEDDAEEAKGDLDVGPFLSSGEDFPRGFVEADFLLPRLGRSVLLKGVAVGDELHLGFVVEGDGLKDVE